MFGFSQVCTSGYDCESSTCRGGVCCSPKGASDGCIACGSSSGLAGSCSKCATGYTLTDNNQCTRSAVAVPRVTPVLCSANCTGSMYNDTQCDLECNTYNCRCGFMSHASSTMADVHDPPKKNMLVWQVARTALLSITRCHLMHFGVSTKHG